MSNKVTTVVPCLNEEGSIESCIRHIQESFAEKGGWDLEVLVVDNNSTDRSKEIAEKAGARVITERRRGYGSAILRGLREASGDYLLIGDADNTYDYRDGVRLVEELRKGAEFSMGDRIHGIIEPGAMPWLHQHIGTPVLSWVLSRIFGGRVQDINCGLRALRKDSLESLKLRSTGMEFASEMVIHAQKAKLKIAELPIRYYRRKHGEAKLRTFRDGWRHLRFILLCTPLYIYFIPAFLGILFSAWSFTSPRFGYQVMASLSLLVSTQMIIFGLLAKSVLWMSDSFLVDQKFGNNLENFKLEYGIGAALVLFVSGGLLINQWDLTSLIRGSTLISISIQLFFSSFLISTLLLKRRF